MKKITKVVGYCRVSTEEQKKYGYSINAQIDKIKNWCEEKEYELINIFVDEGFTASNMKRPQLQALLNSLDNIDLIVFTRLDRLSRNVLQANKMLELFNKHNVSMKTIEEDDIDTTNADGMFMFQLKVSLAERELKKTSERIKSVFEYKVKSGYAISGGVPLGYKLDENKRYVFDENKELVEEVFNYFATYQSVRQTMIHINEKYGVVRDYSFYSRLLRKEIYAGIYKDNKNFCPPYIDIETYRRNQELIKKNIKLSKKTRYYLFTGLIKCPCCNKTLSSNPGVIGSNGKRIPRYRCNRAVNQKNCNFSTVLYESKIERILMATLEEDFKKYVLDTRKINDKRKNNPKKEITTIKNQMENLNYLFKKGRISLNEYETEYDELETKLKKLEANRIEEIDVSHIEKILNTNWKAIYNELDQQKKQAFWRNIIKEIIIVGGKYDFEIKF